MEQPDFENLLVRHLNEPQQTDLAELVNTLRKQSAANESLYQQVVQLWNAAPETAFLDQLDKQASLENFKSKLPGGDPVHRGYWWRSIAAILVMSVAGYFLYTANRPVKEKFAETRQEIDSLRLADGSTVILAAHSRIGYPEHFAGTSRMIRLIRGQAFFKIHRDTLKPFSITVGPSVVKVLGTSFNINYTADGVKLAVRTGKVQFNPNLKSGAQLLTAGQSADYNFKTNSLTLAQAANADAWLTRELKFVDAPLKDVCRQLSEYYHIVIYPEDQFTDARKLNADFKDSSLDDVLALLKATYRLKLVRKQDTIIIRN